MTKSSKILSTSNIRRSVLLFAAAMFLIVGCGEEQTQLTRREPKLTPDGKTIIEFWQFWTDPSVRPLIDRMVAEFESEHPQYKVEITDLTWSDGHQKIVAAFAAGEVPDLMELGSDWIAEFAAADALYDLTAESNRMRGEYAGWPPTFWQGRCYALPWYLSTRVIFQNNDLVRSIGVTKGTQPALWPQFLDAVTQLNMYRSRGIYGFGCNAPEKHVLYKKFLPFFWSNGGQILSLDGTRCMLNSQAGVEALEFYTSLCAGAIIEKQAILDQMFVDGQIAWVMSGDWLYKKLKEADLRFTFSVVFTPQPAPNVGANVSFSGGEYLTVPRAANNPTGAIELARALLLPKNIVNLNIVTGGSTPVSRAAVQNPYFIEDPIRVRFLQQFNSSQSPPAHPNWLDMEAILEEAVEKALYGTLSAQEALDEATTRIDKLL